MEFSGYWEYSVDDRNRVPIPPFYREAFGMKALLVPGPDRVIEIYNEEGWEERAAPLKKLPMTNPQARKKVRAFYANTAPVVPDGQGRLVIPPRFLQYAGIGDDRKVVVAGRRNCLEIWNKAAWDEQLFELDEDSFDILNDPEIFAEPEMGVEAE
ncbi:MAG: hypothetical protein M0R74_15510 [Dehalococcoidia bacterium]|nr:hypothetical protein [Dehalococcoidia bacterium]